MKRLFCLLVFAIVMFSVNSWSAPASDPSFFGKYCGETRVCKKNAIGPIDKCKDVKDIKATLEYTESGKGGLVHGDGTARVDDDTLNFSMAGVVVRPRVLRGQVSAPGLGNRAGWAYLSPEGTVMTISIPEAEGEGSGTKKVELSKFACNNTPPVAEITRFPNAPVEYGLTVFLGAEVSDAQDVSFPEERLVWISDSIGAFDTGLSASTNNLPPGTHTITFSATDSGGLTTKDSVQVTVVNKPPDTPKIFSPVMGGTISSGCNTRFLGQAYDQEDGYIRGSGLIWSSNVEGFIGTGESLLTSLNIVGPQVITLQAKDSLGETSTKQHTVEVLEPGAGGCAPIANIVTPPHNEFQEAMVVFRDTGTGENPRITFVGTAEDTEDTIDMLDLEWRVTPANCTSLGTTIISQSTTVPEVEFIPSPAINKTCNVRFKVRDSQGNTASDEMIVLVLSQPIL